MRNTGTNATGVVLLQPDPRTLAGDARTLEERGASALWLTDHLFWHQETVEVLGALAVVAGAVRECTVGSLVLQLPLRRAATVAKAAGFIEQLAPRRLILGVGVGEHEGEYRAAGLGDDYRRRGATLNRMIPELRRLLTDSGDRSERYRMLPAPGPVPIWIGGRSEAAIRRAAVLGDGWIPHFLTPTEYAAGSRNLDRAAEAAGRDPDSITRGAVVAISIDDVEPDADPSGWFGSLYRQDPRVFDRLVLKGSLSSVHERIEEYRLAGADHIALVVPGSRPLQHLHAYLDFPGSGGSPAH